MPRDMNFEKPNTPISITKHQKNRMRVYAEPVIENIKNERDELVFERILSFYEKNHVVEDRTPKPTYYKKSK